MGVPGLYNWLSHRFPAIITNMNAETDYDVDNLYLDFNSIIHPCTDKTIRDLKEIDEKLHDTLERYIDAVMAYVKPKKMLYISIDGVAPRAKINGQRERRFGGAQSHFKHNIFYLNEEEKLEGDADLVFDGNSITPGTEFMYRLDMFLRTLVKYKLSSGDPLWKGKKLFTAITKDQEKVNKRYLNI